MNNEKEIKAFVLASSHILCEQLPSEWRDWDDEKLAEFLVANAWQPFEDYEPEALYEIIKDFANTILSFNQ